MLAHNLESLRRKANLTYKQLAVACNVSESTISRICTGETSEPNFSTVMGIVSACGGSLDELIGIKEVGSTKSAVDALKDEYEGRIEKIKAEHHTSMMELSAAHEREIKLLVAEAERRERNNDRRFNIFVAISAFVIMFVDTFSILLLKLF